MFAYCQQEKCSNMFLSRMILDPNTFEIMKTFTEAKCCKISNMRQQIRGLTQHDGFIVNCLNVHIHILEIAYFDHDLESGPLEENA